MIAGDTQLAGAICTIVQILKEKFFKQIQSFDGIVQPIETKSPPIAGIAVY